MIEYIIIGILMFALILGGVLYYFKQFRNKPKPEIEIRPDDVATMAEYIRNQQQREQATARAKDEKRDLMKQQLDTFKQTKQQLTMRLKSQIDAKTWKPLNEVLKSADKGGVGIYILYNETQNKYYVGQAKQIYKRIRDHFVVEDIARDFMRGDKIHIKVMNANEFEASYRLDHIEKTAIEIFDADKSGYNKSTGNVH